MTATAESLDTALLDAVIGAALSKGGDFAEIFVEGRRTTRIVHDNRLVEDISSGGERGAGIRVVVGESTGFAHTADLSRAGLERAARAAASVARSTSSGARTVSLEVQRDAGRNTARIDPDTVGKADKIEILQRADDVARSLDSAVVQVKTIYGDARRSILIANSEGLLVSDDQVRTSLGVICVASGDGGMQTGNETIALSRGFELFEDYPVGELAARAARRAVAKLAARPAPSGVVPVVIERGSGGVLFHEACGHGLEADHIVKDCSVYRGRVGERVASPLVTLVDDATAGANWGSLGVDDEGRPGRRNVLIEGGVLEDYMWDRMSGEKGSRQSSGNGRRESYRHLPMVRMTNTFLLPGKDDPNDIVADTPFGVYVAQLGGGQVNTTTGDFVFGMTEAYLIENGRITAPIRDANLIGNGPDILAKVDAVASDFDMSPGTCGKDGQSVPVGCGQPTLRVSGITVGGTAGA